MVIDWLSFIISLLVVLLLRALRPWLNDLFSIILLFRLLLVGFLVLIMPLSYWVCYVAFIHCAPLVRASHLGRILHLLRILLCSISWSWSLIIEIVCVVLVLGLWPLLIPLSSYVWALPQELSLMSLLAFLYINFLDFHLRFQIPFLLKLAFKEFFECHLLMDYGLIIYDFFHIFITHPYQSISFIGRHIILRIIVVNVGPLAVFIVF